MASGGQTSDRAVVREELMGPSPPKLFTLRENNVPVLKKIDTPSK